MRNTLNTILTLREVGAHIPKTDKRDDIDKIY